MDSGNGARQSATTHIDYSGAVPDSQAGAPEM